MPLPPPPPPVTAHAAASHQERVLVRAINAQRRRHGIRGLRMTVSLSRVARGASRRTVRRGSMSHAGLPSRMARAGADFRRTGETLAWIPRGRSARARSVVRLWLRSPSHRSALLDPSFRRIGVARVRGRRGTAFAVDLASLR